MLSRNGVGRQTSTRADNIESNISSIAVDTSAAAEELTTASDYQRKAGRRAACLMIIMVIVVAVVLLAVRIHDQFIQLFGAHQGAGDTDIILRACRY